MTDQLSDGSNGLAATYRKGLSLVDSSPQDALRILQQVRRDCDALSLFSSNESIDDMSNKTIPLLALPHFIALSMMNLPVEMGKMQLRNENILQAINVWSSFLTKLEQLELLSHEEISEFEFLMEADDINKIPPAKQREDKIARFKIKQQCKKEVERLMGLRQRRERLGVSDNEDLDGFDGDNLERNVALQELSVNKSEAFENLMQAKRELPMIEMMVEREKDTTAINRYKGGPHQGNEDDRPPPRGSMKVTHITKDGAGQIQIKREELKSQVFKPGWNLPTMSLEELADREVMQAKAREQNQKEAEKERIHQPRRYEELVKDGLEDDKDLVDASVKLDREWDVFREENPRGSGNKRGDVGDRNF